MDLGTRRQPKLIIAMAGLSLLATSKRSSPAQGEIAEC